MEREQLLASNGESSSAPCKNRSQIMAGCFRYSLLMGITICILLLPVFFTVFPSRGNKLVETNVNGNAEQCDLFSGEWIHDPLGPSYTNETCNFIDSFQDCMTNGRPDTLYLHWRWKPYGCDIPRFNATKFLNAVRNKSWGFIGDSIFRNHAQSLICLISKVEEPVELYHDKYWQTKIWYFPSHNFTLANIWAPFLVKEVTPDQPDVKSKGPIHIHLDVLDERWTSIYHNYDYIVIAGGQWFLKTFYIKENDTIIGCHSCTDYEELGLDYPYRKSLQLALRFIATSNHKPLVMFRTWNPSHFEYGEWFSGGICNRTLPYKEGEFSGLWVDSIMRGVEVEEFEKAAMLGWTNGARMKLLDIYHLSMLRPDGHPGPYRHFHPFSKDKSAKVQNDCLHWCLPGPIDKWNTLIMEMMLTEGEIE